MQQILSYPVTFQHPAEPFLLRLPASARILSVQMVRGVPMLWALSKENDQSMIARRFVVYSTNQFIPDDIAPQDFVATWQNESLVFHLFRAPAVS